MALPHAGDNRSGLNDIVNGYVNLNKGPCTLCDKWAPLKSGAEASAGALLVESPLCQECYVTFNGMRFHAYIQRPIREKKPPSSFIPGSNNNYLKSPSKQRVSGHRGDQNFVLCDSGNCTTCKADIDKENYYHQELKRLVINRNIRNTKKDVSMCKLAGDMDSEGFEVWKTGLNSSPDLLLANSK
jgi:hypothetical protein